MTGTAENAMVDLNAQLTALVNGQEQMRTEMNNNFVRQQEQTRTEMNSNFVRQSTQLAAMIDAKLGALRSEIDGKLSGFGQELEALRARVVAVEQYPNSSSVTVTSSVDALRNRITTVEAGMAACATLTDQAAHRLIVKGLPDSEQARDLVGQCEELLSQLHVQVRVMAATRIGEVGTRPRPVAMTLSSLDDLKLIMRNKRKLKDSTNYRSVYIEPDRPMEIRTLEMSVRRLDREIPGVEYRRGRVVSSDGDRRDARTNDGSAGNNRN